MVLVSTVDLVVIAVYMVLMVAVGVILSLYNKDDSDFFKSGNKMPWWLSGISLFMTSFSVYTFTGAAGLAYRAPSVALLMYLSNGIAVAFSVFYLAARWRRSRASTIMSYLSERYGISTNQLYSWTHLGVGIVQGGVMLLALGKFVSVAMGSGLYTTIIICGLVISIYCIIGGLWGVVVTDTLQFMVLFPTALVVMVLAFVALGDFSNLTVAAPEGFWKVETQEFGWAFLIANQIMMTFAMSSGAAAQRYFSVRDEKEARKVAMVTMILLLVAPVIWLSPPIVTRLLNIDLTSITVGLNAPQEAAYVAFCLKYLPHGAIGILLAAMLSATMSSLSSNFNMYAGVITEDIVKQVFWKTATPKALLFVGRVVTLLLGALVTVAAILEANIQGGVFKAMMTISGVVIVPAGIPIICGLFWRHTPWWAAWASFGTGLLIGMLYLILGQNPTFNQQIFYIGGLSALIYFIPGIFIKARGKYKEKLDAFFRKVTTPIAKEEVGDSEATDVGSFKITGWTTVGMGLAAMLLVLLDVPFMGRMINLAITGMMTLFGVLVLFANWVIQRGRRKKASVPD
jgi:solute:Na+ symporter, SSS family